MFEINLICDKAINPKLKKDIRQYFMIGIIICCTIFIFLLVKTIGITSKITRYEKQKMNINNDIKKVVDRYNIQEWGNQWLYNLKNLSLIKNMYNVKTMWGTYLYEIVNLLPEKVCIEKITASPKNDGILLHLITLTEGQGEFDLIKQFSQDVEKSEYFGAVKLESQERTMIEDKEVKIISLIISLKKTISGKN